MVCHHHRTVAHGIPLGFRSIQPVPQRPDGACHRPVQHLVEITVIQGAIIPHAQGISTHQPRHRSWIERPDQTLHVRIVILTFPEIVQKTCDGHVVDGQQTIEGQTPFSQRPSETGFQICGRPREKGPRRIVDQIQNQPGFRHPVAHGMEPTQSPDAGIKHPFPPLTVCSLCCMVWQTADHPNALGCKPLGQVVKPGMGFDDGEIGPDDDFQVH